MSQSLNLTPLQWAEKACDTMIDKFDASDLPPVGRFHYHQGVFLLGMQKCWLQNHNAKYFDYIRSWVDSLVGPDGHVDVQHPDQLDDIQPGILLFELYEHTHDERYKKALFQLMTCFDGIKRTSEGGYWHKENCPSQMWLDGLFMGGPIVTEFAAKFDRSALFDTATLQALLMARHNRDDKTGLLYHGWDESKKAPWADPATGKAPEFWGRAVGWFTTALLDILEYLPQSHHDRARLIEIFRDLMLAVIRYQDEKTGMWYQVLNKGDDPANWPETSCTSLFVYSIAKAVRMGLLEEKFLACARKGYEGVIDGLRFDDGGHVLIGGVCIGTGIGDYPFYLARPTSVNDLHGVGAFLLMCDEMNLAK